MPRNPLTVRRVAALVLRKWPKRALKTWSLWMLHSKRFVRKSPPVCESVKAWVAQHEGTDADVLLEACDASRTPPSTVEGELASDYLGRLETSFSEKYLAQVHGTRIIGRSGLVILPDGSYAIEPVYTRPILKRDVDYFDSPPRPVVRKEGSYFSLLAIWAKDGNYYHWLHDAVLRLYGVLERLPSEVRYVVPDDLQSFQRESLRVLGIQSHQLEFFSGQEIWELDTLYFSPATSNSGSSRSDALEWLRSSFLAGCGVEKSGGRRRLFLSRRLASYRRTTNEEAVEKLLQREGFETVMPEKLSLCEQVELFSQAEAVVGPHGSALTNIVFAPPGCVVVDMIPRAVKKKYVLWTLAEASGHRYWYFVADSVSKRKSEGRYVTGPLHRDVTIPLAKLELTLDRALS